MDAPLWAVIPAAGRGTRFGGDIPKQYLQAAGQPLIAHALDALLAHPRVAGAMVALAPDDPLWPGWTERRGKPVSQCIGGGERADSVLAALRALPASVGDDALVLVHDAARPNLHADDLDRLIKAATAHADGAILAAPVRDTLKRADADTRIAATQPRDGLWRAMTPQAFRRGMLIAALEQAHAAGIAVTDEAMAVERLGARPRLVEGREDNLKVTTPADLALVHYLLARRDPAMAMSPKGTSFGA
ncbi:2-C-methyl-D-erythritol 4-phosphate cytidylyltransferase [Lysobacter koreensis]|uniref:2-C-methyl-D-erythritol 4-phosphate cytidylyltransferase n=1 Tax=Lysobacter koreensis TaxID=266122 RepID=A0ABW2YPQ4_9GAMM